MAYRRSTARRSGSTRSRSSTRKGAARNYSRPRRVSRGRSAPSRGTSGGVLKIVIEQQSSSPDLTSLLGTGGNALTKTEMKRKGRF